MTFYLKESVWDLSGASSAEGGRPPFRGQGVTFPTAVTGVACSRLCPRVTWLLAQDPGSETLTTLATPQQLALGTALTFLSPTSVPLPRTVLVNFSA